MQESVEEEDVENVVGSMMLTSSMMQMFSCRPLCMIMFKGDNEE